jgi:hypothetical protein
MTGGVGAGALAHPEAGPGTLPEREGETRPRGGLVGVLDLVLGIVFFVAFGPGRERLVDGERLCGRMSLTLSGETVSES